MSPRLALFTFTVLPLMILATCLFSRRRASPSARPAPAWPRWSATWPKISPACGSSRPSPRKKASQERFQRGQPGKPRWPTSTPCLSPSSSCPRSSSWACWPPPSSSGLAAAGHRAAGHPRRPGRFPRLCHPLFPAHPGAQPALHHPAVGHGGRRAGLRCSTRPPTSRTPRRHQQCRRSRAR